MCNGNNNVLSSEASECNAKALCHQEDLKVRQVVVRELEGLEFPALILRVHDDEADVVYIDDGQVEYDVPIEELNVSADVQASKEEIDEVWRKALDSVAANYSSDESDEEDTPVTNCQQGGKYVAADGTLIISHVDEDAGSKPVPPITSTSPCGSDRAAEKTVSEQLANTCASPNNPEAEKDGFESFSKSLEDKVQQPDCLSCSSDSSVNAQPQAGSEPVSLTIPKSPCSPDCVAEKAVSEQLASTCASPLEDEEDDCESLPESSDNKGKPPDCLSFSSDSSDDDQPQPCDPNRQRADRLEVAQFCGIDGVELRKQGKANEAENQLRRSIDIFEEELGEDHPYTLTSRNNLANVLITNGKLQDAEIEYRRCLASKLEQLGNEHPVVATTQYNLGLVLSKRGFLEESEESLKDALRIQVQCLGDESAEAVKTSRSLCRVLLKQGKRIDEL